MILLNNELTADFCSNQVGCFLKFLAEMKQKRTFYSPIFRTFATLRDVSILRECDDDGHAPPRPESLRNFCVHFSHPVHLHSARPNSARTRTPLQILVQLFSSSSPALHRIASRLFSPRLRKNVLRLGCDDRRRKEKMNRVRSILYFTFS